MGACDEEDEKDEEEQELTSLCYWRTKLALSVGIVVVIY